MYNSRLSSLMQVDTGGWGQVQFYESLFYPHIKNVPLKLYFVFK
jgi:hypothetical protein